MAFLVHGITLANQKPHQFQRTFDLLPRSAARPPAKRLCACASLYARAPNRLTIGMFAMCRSRLVQACLPF